MRLALSVPYGTSSISLGDGLTFADCPRGEALEKAVAHAAENLRHWCGAGSTSVSPRLTAIGLLFADGSETRKAPSLGATV